MQQLQPRAVPFAPEVRGEWIRYHDHVEALCQPDGALHPVRGLAAKSAEQAARVSIAKHESNYDLFAMALEAMFLAEQGESVIADSIVGQIRSKSVDAGQDLSEYHRAEGMVLLAEGKPDKAIGELEHCDSTTIVHPLAWNYFYAWGLKSAGRFADATRVYENILTRLDPERLYFGNWDILTRFYLAQCYEKLDNKAQAIKRYQEFVTLWKDNDFDCPQIKEAGESLSRLRRDS